MTKDIATRDEVALDQPRDPAGQIKRLMEDVLHNDLRDVDLKRYMYEEDDVLVAAGLSAAQRRKVRGWEQPRKDIAFGLQASHERVTSMLRRESDGPKTNLNIQNLNLVLPEKNKEAAKAQDVTYVVVEGHDED